MNKYEVLSKLSHDGIVAVIRISNTDILYPTIEAIKRGGIRAIEVTCTVPNADLIIKELSKDGGLLVGAGTVLDEVSARLCIMRGASFIVSPQFSASVAKMCNLYGVPYIPGVATSFEICQALELGSSLLKVFPASTLPPSIIKDFLGPFPNCSFMPTGGIDLENIEEWIRGGASVVGVGGVLTKGAKVGDYALVEETAKKFVQKIEKARQ